MTVPGLWHPRHDWTPYVPSLVDLGATWEEFFHHTADNGPDHFDAAYLRNVEAYEMSRGDGLRAIAYHKLFFMNGDCAEGRPINKQGGATLNHNAVSRAYCLVGNFENKRPTQAAFDRLVYEVQLDRKRGYLSGINARSHSAVFPTACCGRFFKEQVVGVVNRIIGAPVNIAPDPLAAEWVAIRKIAASILSPKVSMVPGPHLKIGVTGQDIVNWQDALNVALKPRYAIENDGKYGLTTFAKTLEFQRFWSLTADVPGEVGPYGQTRRMMGWTLDSIAKTG